MTVLKTKSLGYDDVNLIAQPQNFLASRSLVPLELERIIVSPMAAVVGETFAIEAFSLGLSVCLHRFCKVEEQISIAKKLHSPTPHNKVWHSVGLNDMKSVEKILKASTSKPNILIDVANGYLRPVVDFAGNVKGLDCNVMAGNVHSMKGVEMYDHAGIPCSLRVGIGGGSVCKTSTVTGFTRGQITEIDECAQYADDAATHIYIVADGGIAGSGEALKAFGAGADYVMMGGYFSRAREAQTVIDGKYAYWGGASWYQLTLNNKPQAHVEGDVKAVDKDYVQPLKTLVSFLWEGIASGVSYSGYNTLSRFIGNGVFEVKANG